jgi:hypothetical protein
MADCSFSGTKTSVLLLLPDGVTISAPYDSSSNLPCLQLTNLPPATSQFFAHSCDFADADADAWATFLSVTSPTNINLDPEEKELLLWHQRLSHISLDKVRRLCTKTRWSKLIALLLDLWFVIPSYPSNFLRLPSVLLLE